MVWHQLCCRPRFEVPRSAARESVAISVVRVIANEWFAHRSRLSLTDRKIRRTARSRGAASAQWGSLRLLLRMRRPQSRRYAYRGPGERLLADRSFIPATGQRGLGWMNRHKKIGRLKSQVTRSGHVKPTAVRRMHCPQEDPIAMGTS